MAWTADESPTQPPQPRRGRAGRRSSRVPVMLRQPLAVARNFGPGLIAGASDNDPTTVATLAVVGSTTGFGLAWLMILVIPMLMIVQAVSATIGVRAKEGLEDAVRLRYGQFWALVAMGSVLAVNVLTLAADMEGGAAAVGLLTGLPYQWFILPFALGVAAFLVWGNYAEMERVLKYILLIFVAYVITAFLVHPNWGDVLYHTFVPHFDFSSPYYVAGAIALLGTTLTSYAYVWETIEVAEENPPLDRLGLVQVDATLGVAGAGLLFWFILITTGATLGVHHQTVHTAQDAAAALAPLAGRYASLIFGVGLLASAVLAVPVLAGTSAYVMAEAFGWRASLDASFQRAPKFYLALLFSLLLALGITMLGIGPIQLLFVSSIAGGLATPITLFLMMLIARDPRVMGTQRIGWRLSLGGFAVTAVVTAASLLYLWQTFMPGGH
jgi:Mn2+/Fe2+ NRAMP family transporter